MVAGDALLAQGYPAIHAVGRASHRAPRIIELSWGDASHPHVAICGKGVCFDTGGLDIKTAVGMRNMKKDMGGAAHALALAGLAMARRLPLRITVLIAAVFCLCNRYVDGLATWAPDDPAFYRQRAALVAENGYAASTLTGPTK